MKLKTKVLFRVWRGENHGVIAIFPQVPGTNSPYTCQSYEHVGQHGACDPQLVIRASRPATRKEYQELKRELENYGPPDAHYNLAIARRTGQSDLAIRRRELSGVEVTGEYSRLGYAVVATRHGAVIKDYSGGNSPADSCVQTDSRHAFPLRKIRAMCIQTAREIAAEKQGTFEGVTRIADGE